MRKIQFSGKSAQTDSDELPQMELTGDKPYKFTPIDQLSAQKRKEVSARISGQIKAFKIDWERFVVGINEDGKISFRARAEWEGQNIGGATCLAPSSYATFSCCAQ